MSNDCQSVSRGLRILFLLVAGVFPGLATAGGSEAPPAAPRAALLHLDAEMGDDHATGLSWDEPLRSLEEVQRRMDEGLIVSGLRLAAGWYPGALQASRSLRVEGGYPPAGLPREGTARFRGEPARHRTVLDALGASAVLSASGGTLSVDGVVLAGGWSLEGGAIAASNARVSLTRCELLDSGPALLGCRDCPRVEVEDSRFARAATAGVALFGETRTELLVRRSEFDGLRRAVSAEAAAEVELSDCRLKALEREALALPDGSRAGLSRVEEISSEDAAVARAPTGPAGPGEGPPSPASAHRPADR